MSYHVYGVKAVKALVWFIMTLYTYFHPLESSNFASFLRLVPMFQPSLEPWAPWEHRKRRKRAVWEVPWICVQSLNGGTEGPKNWKPRKFPDQLWNILQVFLDIPGMIDPKTSMKSFRDPNFVGFNFQFLWLPGIVDRGSWGEVCVSRVPLVEAPDSKKGAIPPSAWSHSTIPQVFMVVVWFDNFMILILVDRINTDWTFGFCQVRCVCFCVLPLLKCCFFFWCFANVLCFFCISMVHSMPCGPLPLQPSNHLGKEYRIHSYQLLHRFFMVFHHLHSKHFNLLWIGIQVNLSNPRKKNTVPLSTLAFKSTFQILPKKKQFNWVQREIAEKSQHGNCVAWWHVARRSFFAKRFENWGLPWRISQMALQPLRVLPWRVRQEKLSCWGAKQS